MKVFAAVLAVAVALIPAAPAAAAPGPASAPEYWFDQWHVTDLWAGGARGQGVTIAEIDTGVNAGLPELAGKILPGTDFGQRGDGRTDRDEDEFGHGTAMASIMVGRPGLLGITGLAPDARILPVAVPLSGTTDSTAGDHLADAIRYAADHGAKVISMSLGGTRSPSSDAQACPADEQDAVYYAMDKGAVLLAAAGNRGRTDNAVEEPGVCLGVLSVGAVDASGTVAPFSSRHPYLTLCAPGVDIASLSRVAGNAYSGDGTSQATAIASAAVALVWSAHPTDGARDIVTRVLATLDGRRAKPDPAYGYGRLDTYAAVTASVPAGAANPVYAAAAPFRARAAALRAQQVPPPPKPAARPVQNTGSFVIGNAPSVLVAEVLIGLAVGVAGLAGLVALALIGLRRRRARLAEEAAVAAAQAPLPTIVDEAGVQWHDILHQNAPQDFPE